MEIHHIASGMNETFVLCVQLTSQAAETNENKTKRRGKQYCAFGVRVAWSFLLWESSVQMDFQVMY